ncbi:depupylase/deamidase Dop [Pseudonocardia phyllosphaerae]|uniref:depupylase/deamidase Dop n=1 Tax=Pseudonocardia phyllosphaerae TaxID=3390502 RepID=UPI0039784037
MGAETEYGIATPGRSEPDALLAPAQVVNAHRAATAGSSRHAGWDFAQENPLRDARGFDLARAAADPALLTDDGLEPANLTLRNGGRLYVDHAHPEYSTPECADPLSVVVWDKAGERIVAEAAERAADLPGGAGIQLYKNNTDNKGATYGAHENYLVRRSTPFSEIARALIPFLVSRQVVCGAGRVGVGTEGREHGFQISQRPDFFEAEVGLETTSRRPIVNTRDEPHADAERYRRLHLIIGDATMSEVSTYLRFGTTSLVLSMIEDSALSEDLTLDAPLTELRAVSHDPALRHLVTLRDGRRMTALELQGRYLEQARAHVRARPGVDADPATAEVLSRWESVLARLDEDVMQLSGELDWVAKLALLEGYRRRDGLDWNSPTLQMLDLQYHDVRPSRGLYHRLVARDRMVRLTDDDTVARAVDAAPEDTRAYFRGRCVQQFPGAVSVASWSSVVFDIPARSSLTRIPTPDPLRGTRAHVGELMDRCATAADLVRALTGSG